MGRFLLRSGGGHFVSESLGFIIGSVRYIFRRHDGSEDDQQNCQKGETAMQSPHLVRLPPPDERACPNYGRIGR